jgi:DNA-binding transcriptional LysR family regulator
MNFAQFEVLVSIVEAGSFTEGAERIGITQAGASSAVARLEEELGLTLVTRGRAGVALTDAGALVLSEARHMLRHVEAIKQIAARERGQTKGHIRLGSLSVLTGPFVVNIVSAFRRAYPDVDVSFFEGDAAEIIDWIDASVVDVGLVLHPNPRLYSAYLMRDALRLVVPAAHRLASQKSAALSSLASEPFIMPRVGRDFYESSDGAPMSAFATPRFQVGEVSTVLAMIAEGMGISLMPNIVIPKDDTRIRAVDVKPARMLSIGLGVRDVHQVTPVVELFIDYAQQYCQRS